MATKFSKWNSFIRLRVEDVAEILEMHGLHVFTDRTAITGVNYDPEKQEVTIFLTSMLSPKEEKKFVEKWPVVSLPK